MPIDIFNGSSDVFVTLKDDDFKYLVEVKTLQNLVYHVDERKQRVLEPLDPFIINWIVRELTSAVLKKAIEMFITEKEESF